MSPVTPNQIKEAIPSVTGNFCERFLKALTQPRMWWEIAKWMMTEDGNINPDGMGADICALSCFGGSEDGGGSGSVFGYPQNVQASDGAYSDRVRITWNAVFTATNYDVYRNTVNSTDTATLIGTVADTIYDDVTAEAGVNYYYWVRARNDSQTSGYSSHDQGYRSATLTAVADLTASKGFSRTSNPFISLVFTPVDGATEYDFYVNDSNDFSTATLLDSARTPFSNAESTYLCDPAPCIKPIFVDNETELLYVYRPSVAADLFGSKFFWVVAKKVSDGALTAQTSESNAAEGWAVGKGDGTTPLSDASMTSGAAGITTPAGAAEAWIVLYGSGAGGAGGDGDDSGGGGGGGAMIVGWAALASGSKLRVVSTPESDTANAASAANGSNGPQTVVEYSADGSFTDTIVLMTADAPTGGQYVNGADGAGGSGASGSVHANVNDPVIYDGRDGLSANDDKGGRGGNRFGSTRKQGAHWNGFLVTDDDGDGGLLGAGGGSYPNGASPALATGGAGVRGYAYVIYRT